MSDIDTIRARHEAAIRPTNPSDQERADWSTAEVAELLQDRATLLAENDWLRKTNRTLADNLSSESMRLAQTIDERDQLRKTNRTLADNLSSESMKLAQTIDEREQLKDLLSCVRVSTADNGFINVELVRRGAGKFRAMQRRLLEGSNDE